MMNLIGIVIREILTDKQKKQSSLNSRICGNIDSCTSNHQSWNFFVRPLLLLLQMPQPLPLLPMKHGSLKEKWQWGAGNTTKTLDSQ